VLAALGHDDARRRGSVRFSLGRSTTEEEIGTALCWLAEAVAAERSEGPRAICPS